LKVIPSYLMGRVYDLQKQIIEIVLEIGFGRSSPGTSGIPK
jgi:hypothetical protein